VVPVSTDFRGEGKVHDCDRRQTDRPRYGEMIGGIRRGRSAIAPKMLKRGRVYVFACSWCSCQTSTSSQSEAGTAPPASNPCRDFPCRGGWEPVMMSNGRCTCRIASRRRRRF